MAVLSTHWPAPKKEEVKKVEEVKEEEVVIEEDTSIDEIIASLPKKPKEKKKYKIVEWLLWER